MGFCCFFTNTRAGTLIMTHISISLPYKVIEMHMRCAYGEGNQL